MFFWEKVQSCLSVKNLQGKLGNTVRRAITISNVPDPHPEISLLGLAILQ